MIDRSSDEKNIYRYRYRQKLSGISSVRTRLIFTWGLIFGWYTVFQVYIESSLLALVLAVIFVLLGASVHNLGNFLEKYSEQITKHKYEQKLGSDLELKRGLKKKWYKIASGLSEY
jgi:hypothetical protein